MSIENFNETIGNRTRDLPACSAVPQPTAPPRDGEKVGYCYPSGLEKALCKWDIHVPLVTNGLIRHRRHHHHQQQKQHHRIQTSVSYLHIPFNTVAMFSWEQFQRRNKFPVLCPPASVPVPTRYATSR